MSLEYKNYVADLINEGNDAFSNLFEAVITFPVGGLADENDGRAFSVRCTGISHPSIKAKDTYTVRYITSFVDWPSPAVTITRNFDLTFRVDQNYAAYKKLHEVVKPNFNPNTDFVATNIEDLTPSNCEITVYVLDNGSSEGSDVNKKILYRFHQCRIISISPLEFSQGDAKPLTAKASFIFGDMEDMQTNL